VTNKRLHNDHVGAGFRHVTNKRLHNDHIGAGFRHVTNITPA
jgi:hypothetical protein